MTNTHDVCRKVCFPHDRSEPKTLGATRLHLIGTAIMLCAMLSTETLSYAEVPSLGVGDPMPELSQVEWLTDAKSPAWEKGQAYVIQFWATWCAPCISEFPELSKLQRASEETNVQVVGVAVMGNEGTTTPREFLSERNDVNYPMAKDMDDWARTTFLKASGSDNIPMLMLVDGKGRFAWAGLLGDNFHDVFASIVDGTFDMESAISADQLRLRGLEIRQAAAQAERDEDWERVAMLWAQQGELDPERYGWIWVDIYQLFLSHIHDPERANLAVEKFFQGPFGKDPGGLLVLVARVIGGKSEIPEKRKDLDLALRAAKLAASIESNMQASALFKIAELQYVRGNLEEAITALEQGMSLIPEDDEDRAQLENALQEIREELKNADQEGS